jgi:hypothetical protein
MYRPTQNTQFTVLICSSTYAKKQRRRQCEKRKTTKTFPSVDLDLSLVTND